ncbi:hypothetical protein [Aquincola sp. J276]|uniref:hypothetical protein n=1 Tax=Aquincola sp. J276 TaxID=2898432 RepID=UPI0021514497|nr:hypothetical protein [Aquincola sp. J276]MCR5868481.1 hypothetical protein [Aquincola sp. J276]
MNAVLTMSRTAVLAAAFVVAAPVVAEVTVTQTVLSSVCQYCIAAGDVHIRRKDGVEKPLSRLQLRVGDQFMNVAQTLVNRRGQPISPRAAAHRAELAAEFIEWDDAFAGVGVTGSANAFLANAAGNSLASMEVPVLRPTQAKTRTWKDVLQTAGVCLGSQFRVPTYYFFDGEDLPMARFPLGTLGLSEDYRELPPTAQQTICEGKLLPIEEVLKAFAATQLSNARADFEERTSETKIRAYAAAETRAWLDANKPEVLLETAKLIAPAKP